VDGHWGRILSGAALATLLGLSSELAVSNEGDVNGNVVVALHDSAQDTTNQVGQEITRRNLNVQPTLSVRPGRTQGGAGALRGAACAYLW
jgi:type IV secretory pathway VirB10-like protein